LNKGLYPITVTFFEKLGGEELKVFFEGPNLAKQQIPPAALFLRPPAKAPKSQPVKKTNEKHGKRKSAGSS